MKFIAAALSLIFTFTQVVFAHVPTLSVWESRRAAQPHAIDQRLARLMDAAPLPSAISSVPPSLPAARVSAAASSPTDSFLKLLPPDIVTVRDVVTSSRPGPLAGRRVLVIQDVHLNAEAQRNIADLLFRLMGADQAGIVAVEGAVGVFDLARFRRYPDKSITDAVASAFLVANRIGAPSFAGITAKSEPPLFWGVDDAEHYDRNVDAYREGVKNQPAAERSLMAEANRLAQAKRAAFTPTLFALDNDAAAYDSGTEGLGEHLQLLSSLGAFAGLAPEARAMTERFLEAWRLEKNLDFNRADRERRAALETLVAKLSKEEIDGLVQLSLAYRDGRLSFGDYHRAIAGLMERKGVSLDRLPAFRSYLRYVLLSDGIQADRLLAAAQTADAFAFDAAATTPEQRGLIAASRRLALEKKLTQFSLTPQEWTEYARLAGAGSAPASLASFEDFYREAETRSERIVDNLARATERTDRSKVAVLIVGGFHAPDVVHRLHDLGATTAVVSPKLAKIDAAGGTAYLSVFSREKTPLDKLFAGEKLFVYPAFLNISAAEPSAFTAPANEEFEAAQALAERVGAAEVERAPEAFLHRVDRRLAPSRAVHSVVETIRGLTRPRSDRPQLAGAPLQMGSLWNWLGEKMGLSLELRARLSFVEELLYLGVFVYLIPWALVAFAGMPADALPWVRGVMFGMSQLLFAADHRVLYRWTADGKIEATPAGAGTFFASLFIGTLFRVRFLFGADPAIVIVSATIAHALWNNILARHIRWLPLMIAAAASRTTTWWKDSSKTYVAMSVPIYALRRNPAVDPGIGKFTDLGRTYRDVLKPQNVKVVLLLPHYATVDESPYAPVSLFAVQERYIDWAAVPEVSSDQDLLASLVAPADQQDEVDYTAVAAREDRVAAKAFAKFRAAMAIDRERSEPYNLFLRQNRGWLHEYAEFMAIRHILRRPSTEWTDAQVREARADGRFQRAYELYCYKQYIGYRQFAAALNEVQDAGGKVLVDIPFFRGKDSVSVRNSPQYFRDPKNRSAGIRNDNTDQTWGDLALWNWPELAKGSYDYILGPMRHWLRFGVDGARNDAAHFYYPIGQFGDGDEPGDAVVARIASTFQDYDALPVAEAFENKGDDVAKHGIVVIDGNWQRFSTHDDGQRNHIGDPINFLKDIIGRILRPWRDHRTSQFLAFTLGDLDADPRTVKREASGRSEWRYRRPLTPTSARGNLVRFQTDTLPALREAHRPIWDAAPDVREMFEAATHSFVKTPKGTPEIWAASRDWFFEQWGRDTFIAFPGILLATGRFETARELLRSFARFERNGLIPNRIWDPNNPSTIEYNTSDGSMWFIQAFQSYVQYTGDWEFAEEMAPVMRRIMSGYMNGTGWDAGKHINEDPALNDRRIQMDPADGLINVPAQSTWMDADPHGTGAVTPRAGKPVEINALWYANLRFMAQLCERPNVAGRLAEAATYTALADRVRTSFNKEFWNEAEQTLYDLAPEAAHYAAIRPNMLIAVSKGGDLLSPDRKAKVLESAQKDLWTPYGPRTLSPRDSNYHGLYDTGRQPYPGEADFPNHKDYAYHQGTAWPWLIGPYIDALVAVRREQGQSMFVIQDEIRSLLEPIVNDFVNQGSLHEVYDGSPRDDGRQHPGGTSSQAWSVAEVFRVLAEYEVLVPRTVEILDDEGILARLESLARNYQQKFRFEARELLARLNAKDSSEWTVDDRTDADSLIQAAGTAMDWRRGWLANSRHAAQLKGKPVFVVSMEARESASQVASTREEFEEMRRNHHDRLTTNQGGLGDLGGGWKGALGSMGAATTFNPRSEGPEVYFFIPDYRHGVRLSRVDERGWPISDNNSQAWNAVRPKDVGIPPIEDPAHPGQPLTIEVPVFGLGVVRAHYYAVEKDGMKSILVSVDESETGDKLGILNYAYQGRTSTEERFRQQWFFGVAIQKFKERFELPDGPLHLNETATFASAVGRVREHVDQLVGQGVPLDVAYETAMQQVGSELVFFTHTLVDAGVDKFYENVRLGDYVRELFEGSPHLTRDQAWEVTRWMIEGKGDQTDPQSYPGFKFDGKGAKGKPYYSPLNFLARLAYRANGDVVAVSRLNAKKADQFLSEEQGILTPEQVAVKPVLSETNATDEEFFVDAREARVMNLELAEPSQRHPERILDPADPKANEVHRIVTGGRDLPPDYRVAAMPTSELRAIKEENRARAINRVRWGMQDQYIRNITDLIAAVGDTGKSEEQLRELRDRLDLLKARWESWTGQPFPANVADMRDQELVNLLDPHAVTAVWARRIVDYKRMLLTVFGPNLPQLEEYVQTMGDNPKEIDGVIERIGRENHYASLDDMFKDFINLIETQNVQLVFAGPTFDYTGRSMVAVLDRVIERLSATHPKITNRVVYVEAYNDELSHYLVQGADIWLNTPRRPEEASGTSGMKADAVNLTVLDGWAADGGFDGLNVIAIRKGSPDLPMDHPDNWPGRKRTDAERHDDMQAARAIAMNLDEYRYFRALGDTESFEPRKALAHALSRAVKAVVRANPTVSSRDALVTEVRRLLAEHSYHGDHDAIVAFAEQEWKAQRYLVEEAASLHAGLAGASQMYQRKPDDWWNLVRRSLYFKMMVYSVRNSFVGRYVPTSDPQISNAGFETGIFQLWENAARRLEGQRPEQANVIRYARLLKELHFAPHPELSFPADADRVDVTVTIKADADVIGDADLYLYVGNPGGVWKPLPISRDTIVSVAPGEWTARVSIAPQETGVYQVTAFATPHGVMDRRLRRWVNGIGDNTQFERSALTGEHVTNHPKVATPGLVGAWRGSRLSVDQKTAVEGVATIAAIALVVFAVLFAVTPGSPFAHLSDGAWMAVLSSILSIVIVGLGIVGVHIHSGVLQPDDSVVYGARTAVRASLTASSSLLGAPFLAAGMVGLKLGLLSTGAGLALIAIGIAVAVFAHIAANRIELSGTTASSPTSPKSSAARLFFSPGLSGRWANSPLSPSVKTSAEGVLIAALVLTFLISFISLLSSFFVGTPQLGDVAAVAVAASVLTVIITGGLILGEHLANGVLQPNGSVATNARTAVRASLVSATSLLSTPFFAVFVVLLKFSPVSPGIGAALLVAGVIVAVLPHLAINRRIFALAAPARLDRRDYPIVRRTGPLLATGRAQDNRPLDAKDPSVVSTGDRWHLYGTQDRSQRTPYHAVAQNPRGPFKLIGSVELLAADGTPYPGRIEAPGVVFDPQTRTFHMFGQTSFNSLGGDLVHFASVDGQVFRYEGVAVHSDPSIGEAGLYDAHPTVLPDGRLALTYAAMEHVGGDHSWADPDIFLATADSWDGPWTRRGRIMSHDDIPFHNQRGQNDYEWGLEGPEILPLPVEGGYKYLMVGTAFLSDAPRAHRQRVFLAVADRPEGPYSEPTTVIDPAQDAAWAAGENGHASAAVVNSGKGPQLLLYYQARAGEGSPWNVGFAQISLAPLIGNASIPPNTSNGTAASSHGTPSGGATSSVLSADARADASHLSALLRELNDARRDGSPARVAAAIAGLTALERLHLDFFGREAELARRGDADVVRQALTNPAAFAEWQFALSSAERSEGNFQTGHIEDFVTGYAEAIAAGADQNHRDHVAIVATSADESAITAETNQALTVADGRPLTVILPSPANDPEGTTAEKTAAALASRFAGRGVRFLRESDFTGSNADPRAASQAVEDLLLKPALQDAGRLKLLVNRDAGLPDFLVNPLLELGRQDRYRDLVEFVIVTALSNGAFAIRASLGDVERAVAFRDLVLKQA